MPTRSYPLTKALIGNISYLKPADETIVSGKTLTPIDSSIQRLNPGDVNQNIILPDPTYCLGMMMKIINSSTGTGILNIRNHGDTITLFSVVPGDICDFVCFSDWTISSTNGGTGTIHPSVTAHMGNTDIHHYIDDNSTNANELWSANKISSHVYNSDIHHSINDSGTSTTDLWSSSKIASEISANSGSEITINDSGTSITDLWSANKIASEISANSGSEITINDSTTNTSQVWSSNKIASEISANSGSGVTIDDNVTNTSQVWSSSKINAEISASGVINDSATNTSQVWSSSKIAAEILAGSGSGGAVINDSATNSTQAWSSHKISTELSAINGATINDNLINQTTAWSSDKISSYCVNTSSDQTITGYKTFTYPTTIASIIGTTTPFHINAANDMGLSATNGKISLTASDVIQFHAANCNNSLKLGNNNAVIGVLGSAPDANSTLDVRGTILSRSGIRLQKTDIATDAVDQSSEAIIQNKSVSHHAAVIEGYGHEGEGYLYLTGQCCVSVDTELLPQTDAVHNLGHPGWRWNDFYAMNSTIQTSDIRQKENIRQLSDNELDLIMAIEPISFKWIDIKTDAEIKKIKRPRKETIRKLVEKIDLVGDKWTKVKDVIETEQEIFEEFDLYDENGNIIGKHRIPVMEDAVEIINNEVDIKYNRQHYGISSQQMKEAIESIGMNPDDVAAFIYNKESDLYGVRYTELIPLLIHAVQHLKNEIDILKNN